MRTRPVLTLLAVSLLAACGTAREQPVSSPDEKKPATETQPVRVSLRDGSIVIMTLLQSHVEVTTRYGQLSVPLREVRRIEFALRLPPGVAERIERAAGRLGSEDFKERENAAAELLQLQELSYTTLLKLRKSTDKEVSRRAEELLTKLREKLPEEKLRIKTQDTLVADAFTVVGRIEGTTLRAKSIYFGEAPLQLADLRSLRRVVGDGSAREIGLDLGKYGMAEPVWLDTGIEVAGDTELGIRATGDMDLNPLGGNAGNFRTGPRGTAQWGARGPWPPGQLLGRIGPKGKEFVIGDKYEGKPEGEGNLFLRAAGSPWQVPSSGEYHVRVELR